MQVLINKKEFFKEMMWSVKNKILVFLMLSSMLSVIGQVNNDYYFATKISTKEGLVNNYCRKVVSDSMNDLGEINDLTVDHIQKSDKLLASYKQWEQNMMELLWDEGERWIKVTNHIQKSLMQNKQPLYKYPSGLKK